MTTLVAGHKVHISTRLGTRGAEFYAQIHCWCGSTMSSGEYMPTIAQAEAEARAGIEEHQRTGNHAGGFCKAPCVDCGNIAFVSPRESRDGVMVCDRCNAKGGL